MVISRELMVRVSRALLAAAETQRRGTKKVGKPFIIYSPVKIFDLVES